VDILQSMMPISLNYAISESSKLLFYFLFNLVCSHGCKEKSKYKIIIPVADNLFSGSFFNRRFNRSCCRELRNSKLVVFSTLKSESQIYSMVSNIVSN